jgi:hypothetical protein
MLKLSNQLIINTKFIVSIQYSNDVYRGGVYTILMNDKIHYTIFKDQEEYNVLVNYINCLS